MATILNVTANGDWQDVDVPDSISFVNIAIQARTGVDVLWRISGEDTYWTVKSGTSISLDSDIKFNRKVTLLVDDIQVKAAADTIVEIFLYR